MTTTKWQFGLGASLMALVASGGWASAQTENTLLSFSGTNGSTPYTGLIEDAKGHLYGATGAGGTTGWGTVYELIHDRQGTWKQKVLYSFGPDGSSDGASPQMQYLAVDSHGALYGTTRYGGAGKNGTVFKLTRGKSQWTEQILYSFTGGPDGSQPMGTLTIDPKGNLYGTAQIGGDATCNCGVVYELKRGKGGTYTQVVLHAFTGVPPNRQCGLIYDGYAPNYSSVARDSAGNLYGTTSQGGTCDNSGTVWELSPAGGGSWNYSVLHAVVFGDPDTNPNGGVVLDSQGNLYGMGGYSAIYELVKAQGYAHQIIYYVNNEIDAGDDTVTFDQAGNLYWTTFGGGGTGYTGSVEELSPDGQGGWNHSTLYAFAQGQAPGTQLWAGVMLDASGNLYGTSSTGGSGGDGTAWEITP